MNSKYYSAQAAAQPTDVKYASVVVLTLSFTVLIGLGVWLFARRRRRRRRLAASVVPPTPQIAIQEYKPEYDRVSFSLSGSATPVPPSPIHLSPAWAVQPNSSPRISFAPPPSSQPLDKALTVSLGPIERPARATLPAIGSKRLSLHLPVSSSLALELLPAVSDSIASTPSLIVSSTSDSTISAASSRSSGISSVTPSHSEPLALLKKRNFDDAINTKAGHASMFTLPPIITSPAFTEVTEWDDDVRTAALLSIVVVPRDMGMEMEGKGKGNTLGANVAVSDTHQDLIHNFKRFSKCAFTSSSTLSSTGSVTQVPTKDSTSSQLSGVESRGSFDGRCKSPTIVNVKEQSLRRPVEAVVTTCPRNPKEDVGRQDLSPWEKVAILTQKHLETMSATVLTPPLQGNTPTARQQPTTVATPCTPATLDLPSASPQLQMPTTPRSTLPMSM